MLEKHKKRINPLGNIYFEKHGRKTLLWNISSGKAVLYFLLNVISGLNIGIIFFFISAQRYFCFFVQAVLRNYN